MVNRNLKTIADQVGSDEVKKAPVKLWNHPNYEYVPSLDVYVSDHILYKNLSFAEAKGRMRAANMFMLTPAQFWKYYDHCEEKRPDIFRQLRSKRDTDEYLNAILDRKEGEIIINPNPEGKKRNRKIIGDRFKFGMSTVAGLIPCLRKHNEKHGYPSSLGTRGDNTFDFYYLGLGRKSDFELQFSGIPRNVPAVLSSIEEQGCVSLSFSKTKHNTNPPKKYMIGGRPYMTKERAKKLWLEIYG